MKQTLTLACKLDPLLNRLPERQPLSVCRCLQLCQSGSRHLYLTADLSSLWYMTLRERFGLSANLAVRACARVGANRKTSQR